MLHVMLMDFNLAYKSEHNPVRGVLISIKFMIRGT